MNLKYTHYPRLGDLQRKTKQNKKLCFLMTAADLKDVRGKFSKAFGESKQLKKMLRGNILKSVGKTNMKTNGSRTNIQLTRTFNRLYGHFTHSSLHTQGHTNTLETRRKAKL